MPRRIEVELTSSRDDGSWTWRAAGAKQPKGELDGTLLYEGAKVGDVVRADADFDVEGITVVAVLPPKSDNRVAPERLEVIGTRTDEPLVTQTLVKRGRGDRPDRGDRRDRGDRGDRGDRRPRRDGDRRPSDRGDRPGGPGGARGDRSRGEGGGERRDRGERRQRPSRPPVEAKPKPKRLKAGRNHRNAWLETLPEEQKPIAEQVIRGGIPGVRQAIEKQNDALKAAGEQPINADALVGIAENLLPAVREAEWRDRADAALRSIDDLDLRDLRSVVVAADAVARDEEARELAGQLRDALTRRVEQEHNAWLEEIDTTLKEGRVVRALRLSSRPPKAGSRFPDELAARLTTATSEALTSDVTSDRFATVLDALAYAPVRAQVSAQSLPAEPSKELVAAVKKIAGRIPLIAAQFGIEATETKRRSKGKGPSSGRPAGSRPVPPPPAAPKADAPTAPVPDAAPSTDAAPAPAEAEAAPEAPTAEAEASAPEAAPAPDAAAEAPAAETAEATDAAAPVSEAAAAPVPAAAEPPVAAETADATETAEPDDAPSDAGDSADAQ